MQRNCQKRRPMMCRETTSTRACKPEPRCLPQCKAPTLEPTVKNITDTPDGPLVTRSVFGVEETFLVDTGANVTILKPSVVNKIPALEQPFLERIDTSMLLADGSSLPFQGHGRFSIQIGDKQVEHV